MVRAKHAGAQFQSERTIRRSRSLRGTIRRRRNGQKFEKANATVGSWRLHGEKREDCARGISAARLSNEPALGASLARAAARGNSRAISYRCEITLRSFWTWWVFRRVRP